VASAEKVGSWRKKIRRKAGKRKKSQLGFNGYH
jgi:hypothetical protein